MRADSCTIVSTRSLPNLIASHIVFFRCASLQSSITSPPPFTDSVLGLGTGMRVHTARISAALGAAPLDTDTDTNTDTDTDSRIEYRHRHRHRHRHRQARLLPL